MANSKFNTGMRVVHRYLGFFLAGIMCIYSLSGIIMVFRNTDFLKIEKQIEQELAPQLGAEALGRELRMRGFKATEETDQMIRFESGTYNKETGVAQYTRKQLPTILDKFEHMHKATSDRPLFFLNVFFGVSLFFFSISSFWMFMPKTKIFRKGLYFTLGGIILAVIMVLV